MADYPPQQQPRVAGVASSDYTTESSYTTTAESTATTDSEYTGTVHDTLGLHYDDQPETGGVLPGADRSVGSISTLTGSQHYVPLNQIKIPLDSVAEISTHDGSESTPMSDSSTDDKRRDAARTCLDEGMRAFKAAAFEEAADCFEKGRLRLGERGWEIDHDTMLKLCSEGANARYVTGDIESAQQMVDEVLSRDISIQEKFRVYEVKMLVEQGSGRHHESITLGIEVRRQLGLPTPPNKPVSKFAIFAGYLKTSFLLYGRTVEELAGLPDLNDETVKMGQRILELMCTSCFQAQPTMFPLLVFLLINTTLEHGINASSCDGFTGFGVLLCGVLGKPQRGREMAEVAKLLLAKPNMERMKCRTTFICEGCINHWTSPIKDTIVPLIEAHRIGLENGDVESAGNAAGFCLTGCFHSGLPLEKYFLKQAAAFHFGLQGDGLDGPALQELQVISIQKHVLFVNRLRGIELENDQLDFDDIFRYADENRDKSLQTVIRSSRAELHMIFGEWEEALDMVQKVGDVRAANIGMYAGVRATFVMALVYLKAAQTSTGAEGATLKKQAIQEMNVIRAWVRKANVNLVHNLYLLEAELAVLEGKNGQAESNYGHAIDDAARMGFLQDLALTHELASQFYESIGDAAKKDLHTSSSIKYYSEWGAVAKVDQMKRKCHLLQSL